MSASLTILGVKVPISIVSEAAMEAYSGETDLEGHVNVCDGILIRDGLFPGQAVDVLIHEAIHYGMGQLGISLTEAEAVAFTRLFVSVIMENGGGLEGLETIIAEAGMQMAL